MSVVVNKIDRPAQRKWLYHDCPECGSHLVDQVTLNNPSREIGMKVTCVSCGCIFTITWDVSDEKEK